MNTQKKIILLVITVFIGLGLGIGGKMYMDQQAEDKAKEEQKNLLETERESAIVLKQTFADIKSIEFTDSSGPDRQTGTGAYYMYITLTNNLGESLSFDFIYWKEQHSIGSYILEDENIQKKGTTTNTVSVKYTNGKEEEI